MNRRDFIRGSIVAAAAGSGCAVTAPDRTTEIERKPPAADDKWQTVRDRFLLAPEVIEMASLLIAAHPESVRRAIEKHRSGFDRNPTEYLHSAIGENERRVFSTAARYLETGPETIALTGSTTEGLGIIYNGLDVEPGQEFLTTEQNYYSTDESLRLATLKRGSSVRRIALYEDATAVSADELTGTILDGIAPVTRVVALTWVHSSTGLKLPLKDIAEGIREINLDRDEGGQLLLSVDGVHGFGVEADGVEDLGCDFFAAGCHKWLFGPRGTGIIWGSSRGWPHIQPTIPTFIDNSVRAAWLQGGNVTGATTGRRLSPGGFKAYEHQWALAEAFEFHLEIGKKEVESRTHELARQLKEGLASIQGVVLRTPMDESLSSGIVCFDIDGWSPQGVVERLRENRIVATVTPYAQMHVRLTPSIRNSPSEIDAVLRAVEAIA